MNDDEIRLHASFDEPFSVRTDLSGIIDVY
jgi:hypothetical protein